MYTTTIIDACLAYSIRQALANPKTSQELTDFVKDIVHTETAALRHTLQMQRDEISRLQRERMDTINAHAAEVQALHSEYTLKLKHCM